MPALDLDAAARLVGLLPRLAAARLVSGMHDVSVGGLGVALARLAIASGVGATVEVDPGGLATAALFGERGGRVLAALPAASSDRLVAAAREAGVVASRLGAAAGETLRVELGASTLEVSLADLVAAWDRPL
jgi:phosphoribosylformylglycinamidine synthase